MEHYLGHSRNLEVKIPYGEGYTYENEEWPKEIKVIALKKNPKATKYSDYWTVSLVACIKASREDT